MNFITRIKKIIAVAVSLSLLFTIIFNDISYSNIVVNGVPFIENTNSFIPTSFGNISKSRYYNSDEVVINIQDLHCHAQTQRQISSIIGYLENEYNIKEVYLEGAYKNVDTNLLSNFTDTNIGKNIIENLVDEGRINGTEYYSLINKKENFIKPIENEKLYKENINLLNEIIKFKSEVEIVCNDLENQIKTLKKDYSSSKAQALDKLINKFDKKEISTKKYYSTLSKIAKENGIDINLYTNLSKYIDFIQNIKEIDNKKIGKELQQFFSEIKNRISYQEYVNIIKLSNNFKNIDNIIFQIKTLNEQYNISKNLKLNNLESLINQLTFNDKINSESLIEEEENLKEDIYTKLGRTKYEREVSFLSEFIPKIREYFTANISAKEYYKFEKKYIQFRKIWPSYFEVNIVKNLDKYQSLLSKYHSNNIKRDIEFSKRIISKQNLSSSIVIENTTIAKESILKDIKSKKIKVVVTGGFHTQGLENILESKKISYVVITPKITQSIEKAKEIYLNTIEYNNNILKNTINLEPLSQEPINISFPKIMASIFSVANSAQFKDYSKEDILAGIRNFVKEKIIDKQNEKNNVVVKDFYIEGDFFKDKVVFSVEYNNNGKIVNIKYVYSQGNIKQFVENESELNTDTSSVSSKIELLSIFKNIIKATNKNLNLIINILIAPIIEETFFRILPSLPLVITTATIGTNPILLIPTILTSIVGTIFFSYSHELADKTINWKSLLPQSIVLTGTYLALLIVFPEQIFLAPLVSISLHSLNNAIVIFKYKIKNIKIKNVVLKLNILNINSKKEKSELDEAIDKLYDEIYHSGYNDRNNKILAVLKNLPKDKKEKNSILANLIEKVIQEDYDNIIKYYDLDMFFIYKFIPLSVFVKDDKNKPMLNHIIDIICSNNANNSSGKIDDIRYAIGKKYSDMLPKISSMTELDSAIKLLDEKLSKNNNDLAKEIQQILEEKSFSTKYHLFIDLLFRLTDTVEKTSTFKTLFKVFNNIRDVNLFYKAFDKILIDYDKEDIDSIDIYEDKYKKIVEDLISLVNIGWQTEGYVRDISDYLYSNYDIKTNFKVEQLKKEKADQDRKLRIKQEEEQEKRENNLKNRKQQQERNIVLFEQDKESEYLKEIYDLVEYLQDYDVSKQDKFEELVSLLKSDKFFDFGKYIDMKKIKEIYKEYAPNQMIIPSRNSLKGNFSITSLLNFNAFRDTLIQEKPVYITILEPTNFDEQKEKGEDIQALNSIFDTYRLVLQYNRIAMQQLNSSNSISDLLRVEDSLIQMINQFALLNKEYAESARISMENIFKNLRESKSSDTAYLLNHHKKIDKWEVSQIQEISNLNSLINAVHQLSRQDFIKNISRLSKDEIKTRVVKTEHDNAKFRNNRDWIANNLTTLKMYDFSENFSNVDIIEFLNRLSFLKLPYPIYGTNKDYQIDDFVCKNDILVWSNKLGYHSVDIIFDFSEHNREIRISFTESTNGVGNAERIRFFKEILKKLGFTYDDLEYSLNAYFDGNAVLDMNMIDVAVKVIELFKYSAMLDFDLASESQPSNVMESLVEKFMSGYIGYKYRPNDIQGWENEGQELTSFRVDYINVDELSAELDYLGLDNYFKDIPRYGKEITQSMVDKYFNKVIERAYINGKIIFDENGFLIKNENYDIARDIVESYTKDITDTARQARISNIILSSNDETEILGKIGKLYYYGVSRKQLVDGSWILIKKIIDPITNRARYATSEHVTLTSRRQLNNEELTNLLEENGYKISKQDWTYSWAGTKEQNSTKQYLESEVLDIDTPTLFSKTICEGKQNYVVGILGKDIFVTDVMKQQDMPKMVSSKAVITAIGSELSHMAIEVGERGIPTVSLNGAIVKENDIQTTVYYPIKNNRTLNTQVLASKNISLKDGALIGINIQTGEIYLFNTGDDNDDDINIDIKLINKINKCIEKKDIKNLIKLINREKENDKINRIVEYVYFQLSKDGSKSDILFELLKSKDISDEIKNKIEKLNNFYLKEQFIKIEQAIENLKAEENINIKYTILNNILSKLNFIVTVGNQQEQQKQELIDKVGVIEKEIKDELQKWIETNIDKFSTYVKDKQKANENIDDIVRFIQQATYYDMFVSKKETNTYLIKLRLEVLSVVKNLSVFIDSYYTNQNYYSSNKILQFSDITLIDVYNLGSKTTELANISNLRNLQQLDYEVPQGIGIGNNFFKDFIGTEGEILLDAWKQAIKDGDVVVAKEMAHKLINLIEEKRNSSQEFKNIINDVFKNIDVQEFSVRSSGVGGEDSPTSSFAGIGLTSLHVKKSDIYDRILDSWKSFFSDEAIEYEINTRLVVEPAVLVEEMIEADISGIINTSNKYGYLEINVAYGAGQGIVADEVSSDYVLVDKNDDTAITYNTATKDTMVVRNEEGGTKIIPVDTAKRKIRVLDSKQIKDISEIAKALEKDAGYPVDIEFSIKDGKYYFLQRRPITKNNIKQSTSNKSKALTILDNYFKNSTLNKIHSLFVAPIYEEVLFRFVPFAIVGKILFNPITLSICGLPLLQIVATLCIGIGIFSYAHQFMDKQRNESEVRNWKQFVVPSTILTVIYLAISIAFPTSNIVALFVTTALHSLNNIVAEFKDKINNTKLKTILSKIKLLNIVKEDKILKLEGLISENPEEFFKIYTDCINAKDFSSEQCSACETFNKKYSSSPFAYSVINFEEYLIACYKCAPEVFNRLFNSNVGKNLPTSSFWGDDDYFVNTKNIPFSSPFSYSNLIDFENDIIKIIEEDKEKTKKNIKVWNFWAEFFFKIEDEKAQQVGYSILKALYKTNIQNYPPNFIDYEKWNNYIVLDGKENNDSNISQIVSKLKYIKDNYFEYLSSLSAYTTFSSSFEKIKDILKTEEAINSSYNKSMILRLGQTISILENKRQDLENIINYLNSVEENISEEKQKEILEEQLNKLCDILFEKSIDLTILSLMKEFLSSVKCYKSSKNETLLEYYMNKFISNDAIGYIDKNDNNNFKVINFVIDDLMDVLSYTYKRNKEFGLYCIKQVFDSSNLSDIVFISKSFFNFVLPETFEDAIFSLPKSFKGYTYSYEEIENLYLAFGYQFDLVEEKTKNYDRLYFLSPIQKLLQKMPLSKFIEEKFYFRSLKNTDEDAEINVNYFDELEKVVRYNSLALQELNNPGDDSMKYSIKYIKLMIESFKILDKDLGLKAQQALEKIEKDIEQKLVTEKDMLNLYSWSEDNIDKITTLHTLINAVHQTSIQSLMKTYKNKRSSKNQIYLKKGNSYRAEITNCSSKKLTLKMQSFLYELFSSCNYNFRSPIFVFNNKLFCTNKIGEHSLDIFIDLDKGINITFNDSGNGDGNKLRVLLFATLFSQIGFDISNLELGNNGIDVPSCSAFFELPNSINKIDEYAKIFEKVLQITSWSTNLDYRLEDNYNEKTIFDFVEGVHRKGVFQIPQISVEDFKNIKNTRILPRQFEKDDLSKLKYPMQLAIQWEQSIKEIESLEKKFKNRDDIYSKVYEYLKENNKSIGDYWDIVRDFISGKLIINKEGLLSINTQYDGIKYLLYSIQKSHNGKKDVFAKAQLLNLIDYDEFYFEEEGFIGELIYQTGLIQIDDSNWLSIKAVCDKERKRLKCAEVELVDFEGNRKILDYDELLPLLNKKFPYVKWQQERNIGEIENTFKNLQKDIPPFKSAIYSRGQGISAIQNGYVPLKVTYQEESIKNNSLWITPYINPENIKAISSCGGIMMTGTGSLSHASITAKEKGKVALLSRGTWVSGNKISIQYYTQETKKVDDIKIDDKVYHTTKIESKNITLEEDDIVLVNGITGRILIFKNIENIDRLQQFIDNNNIEEIKQYIKNNNTKNIEEIIEYIFLQTIWQEDKKDIIDMLLSWQEEGVIKDKIKELNEINVEEKKSNIKNGLKNIKNIEEESNSRYGAITEEKANILLTIIRNLKNEIKMIRSLDTEQEKEIVELKKQISIKENKIKNLVLRNIETTIEEIDKLLSQNVLTIEEQNRLSKISKKIKVMHYYWHYDGIEELVDRIDDRLRQETSSISKEYSKEIKGFEELGVRDILNYGGKTTELADISNLFSIKNIPGIKVPYGVGISKNVLEIFFENAGKIDEYKNLLSKLEKAIKSKDEKNAVLIGKQIQDLIKETNDSTLEKYLEEKFGSQNKSYAVRSSAVNEDNPDHAFAGMAKTNLNVSSNNIYSNIKDCWSAFYSSTCILDMINEQIIVKPALLVQEMAPEVEFAGVCFSRNEIGKIIEEIVRGYGEGLVSGKIEPDHVLVQPGNELIYEYIRALNVKTKLKSNDKGDGLDIVELDKKEVIDRILDIDMIFKLKEICEITENDSQYPVDIEFAIDKDKNIYVLQRRPITTFVKNEKIDFTSLDYKYNISLEYSKEYDKDNIITYISNPKENFEEAIPVYYKSIEGNDVTLVIDEKYKDIDVVKDLLEKINKDNVVRDRLQEKTKKLLLKDDSFGVLLFDDNLKMNIIEDTKVESDNINRLLSCA